MRTLDSNSQAIFTLKLEYLLKIRQIHRDALPRHRKTQLSAEETPRTKEENDYHVALGELKGDSRSIAKSLCHLYFGKYDKTKKQREVEVTMEKLVDSQILSQESFDKIEDFLRSEEEKRFNGVRVLIEESGLTNEECRQIVQRHWNTKFRGRANGEKFNF